MLQPKKPVKKYVPTAKEKKNLDDASKMKNMRPTGPSGPGRLKPTLGDGKTVAKGGKSIKKAKSGGSFPDLNKDGKITKADILKGRGVIAQKGATVKKKTGMDAVKAVGKYVSTFGGATERDNPKQKDINIVKKLKETGTKVKNKLGLKSGGTVKKCRYGCK